METNEIKKTFRIVKLKQESVNDKKSSLYIGFDDELVMINKRPIGPILKTTNTNHRSNIIHKSLNILGSYLSDDDKDRNIFVKEIMGFSDIKSKVDEMIKEEYKNGFEDGLKEFVNHFSNAAPFILSLMTGKNFDKLVNILFHKQLGQIESVISEVRKINKAFKDKHDVEYEFSKIDEKITKIPKYINVDQIINITLDMINECGGYEECVKMKLFKIVALKISTKLNDIIDINDIDKIKASFESSNGGRIVKLIYCNKYNLKYETSKKFKSHPTVFKDKYNNTHQISIYGRHLNSSSLMQDLKINAIGMQDQNDEMVVIKKIPNNGNIEMKYGELNVSLEEMSKHFGCTFLGNLITKTINGKNVTFRYMDIRVILGRHLYYCYQKELFKIDKLINKRYKIGVTDWKDSVSFEKKGKYVDAIQLIESEFLQDENSNFVRSVLPIVTSWDGETIETAEAMTQQLTIAYIDCETYVWVHPETGTEFVFEFQNLSADNKSKQLSIGNQVGGHVRCSLCDANFNSEDIVKYDPSSHNLKSFKNILERAEHGVQDIDGHVLGLKRISGYFSAYFTDRAKFKLEKNWHQVFGKTTPTFVQTLIQDTTKYLEISFAYEQKQFNFNNCNVENSLFQVTLEKSINNANIEIILSFDIDLNVKSRSCQCSGEHCLHSGFALLYLHYNREGLTLEDFCLQSLQIRSDAGHIIPGIFDRFKSLLMKEKGFKKEKYLSNCKRILGTKVSLGMICHSDKKYLILKGYDLFGNELPETYNPEISDNNIEIEHYSTEQKLDDDVIKAFELLINDNSEEEQHYETYSNNVVSQSFGNLLWIITSLQIVTAIAVMNESTFTKQKRFNMLAFSFASFYLSMLSYERYGSELHSLYLHELVEHLPVQMKQILLSISSTDMFESFLSPLKEYYLKSCHREHEADVNVWIRRELSDQVLRLLPQFSKNYNYSKISKLIENFTLKNIFVPKSFIKSNEIITTSFRVKIKELKEEGFSDLINIQKDGILITLCDSERRYLPKASPHCENIQQGVSKKCLKCKRARAAECSLQMCSFCCTKHEFTLEDTICNYHKEKKSKNTNHITNPVITQKVTFKSKNSRSIPRTTMLNLAKPLITFGSNEYISFTNNNPIHQACVGNSIVYNMNNLVCENFQTNNTNSANLNNLNNTSTNNLNNNNLNNYNLINNLNNNLNNNCNTLINNLNDNLNNNNLNNNCNTLINNLNLTNNNLNNNNLNNYNLINNLNNNLNNNRINNNNLNYNNNLNNYNLINNNLTDNRINLIHNNNLINNRFTNNTYNNLNTYNSINNNNFINDRGNLINSNIINNYIINNNTLINNNSSSIMFNQLPNNANCINLNPPNINVNYTNNNMRNNININRVAPISISSNTSNNPPQKSLSNNRRKDNQLKNNLPVQLSGQYVFHDCSQQQGKKRPRETSM